MSLLFVASALCVLAAIAAAAASKLIPGPQVVSAGPEVPKAPFFSPRNVPLWAGLVMTAIVAGIVLWLH